MDDNGGSGAGVEEDEDIDDDNYDNNYEEECNDSDPYEYEEVNETEEKITKIVTKSTTDKEKENEKRINQIGDDVENKIKIEPTSAELKKMGRNESNIDKGNNDDSSANKIEIDKKSEIKCEKNIENNFTRKTKKTLTVGQRHKKMTEALCDVLSDFGLVSFLPMNVQDGEVSALLFSLLLLF
jgi:hypothetical protein